MSDKAFYLAQAADCEKSAAAATLSNERDKFIAAQRAWLALANRVEDLRLGRIGGRA